MSSPVTQPVVYRYVTVSCAAPSEIKKRAKSAKLHWSDRRVIPGNR